MASTSATGLPPNFILTPQQQALLFRALTSNQQNNASPQPNGMSLSPATLTKSPAQSNAKGVQESPFLDYDYSFGPDSSGFDFDLGLDNAGSMIGDLPGTTAGSEKSGSSDKGSSPDNDSHDKRSHPDEDDDEKEEGSAKRRESEGKVAKKPGRKPLTNEPSSPVQKRKAQNRAAQRAFRERKEQHLKDLETKVEELEKASEQTHNENSQLRAQVDKMAMELNEYKKKLSLVNSGMRSSAAASKTKAAFGSDLVNNLNDVNFQFEFPKFGVLPGAEQNVTKVNGRSPSFPSPTSNFSNQPTPSDRANDKATPDLAKSREGSESDKEALAKFSSIINGNGSYDSFYNNASRTSLDSANFSIGGNNSGSPSASSNSNGGGPSSSCGTSPEPFTQSPLGFKPVDTLTTIGEEQPSQTAGTTNNQFDFGNFDANNFDWLAHQNGGQFDPQLFGGYREPQDNILANATFDDTFFNDAFDADFSTPFNMAPTSPKPVKKNICDQIDASKEDDDSIVIANVNGRLLTCNNIWERLQNCPKVQSGDIDLDGLCSDLQKKAKCGGTGAVVDEKDFKAVMTKHLGPCPDNQQ
ncbi:putative BZIP domain-containing protein [Seiridium cardinale]